MKLRIYIIIIIVVVCLFSCERRDNSVYNPSLLLLENSLEIMPEKTLREILDIDTASFREADKALYYFLLFKAKVLSSDSIQIPIDKSNLSLSYFIEERDSVRLCQLYYYLGRIHFDNYAFFRANSSYNQAEKFVGKDIQRLFDIKIGEARIYHFKMMYDMEEISLKRALNIAGELQDSVYMAKALHEFAELRIDENQFSQAKDFLNKALALFPKNNNSLRAECSKDLARVYLGMNMPDTALFYIDAALRYAHSYELERSCNIIKGSIYMKMRRYKDAESVFMKNIESFPLKDKYDIFFKMSLMKKEEKEFQAAYEYAEKSIRCRDSLEMNNKVGYISNLNAFQEHERQRKRIDQMDLELSERELAYYRLAIILSLLLVLVISFVFRVKHAKKKVELLLKEKELAVVKLRNSRREAEIKYLHERHERESIERDSLNQSLEYYKCLNALTVPILMKSQNSQGAMHLKKEEWDIIIQNTNACFNDFTFRLKEAYPQLSQEEVRFACLLKMEFSLSLLSEIYHIAKGSISRKKMRLKDKMQIDSMTLDDFIKQF